MARIIHTTLNVLIGLAIALIPIALIGRLIAKLGKENYDEVNQPSQERFEFRTRNGLVKGITEKTIGEDSRTYFSFRGIPFAQPPIGDLRFKNPAPVRSWSGVVGGANPPVCTQLNITALLQFHETQVFGQEDCLYLNVFTPKVDSSANLAVMVFIHGGGFYAGDVEMFGGSSGFMLKKDIVLVTIQYRLGTLGFLSTEDTNLPGNYGLKDQIEALRWVQRNIADFGGNPGKVTIFGESAGGASVHLLAASPKASGLFHQVIAQSGTALAVWACIDHHRHYANQISKYLSCPGSGDTAESLDSKKFVKCLREQPAEKIVESQVTNYVWNNLPFTAMPVVDGEVFPEHPAKLIRDGKFNKVNFISGVTAHEAAMFLYGWLMNKNLAQELTDNFDSYGPLTCGIQSEENASDLIKQIYYNYVDEIEISEKYADELVQIVSDCFFFMAHDESILIHAKDAAVSGTKVYAYEFDYLPKAGTVADMLNLAFGKHWINHQTENMFLFDILNDMPSISDPADLAMKDIMVDLWTNFAITGNPTPDLSLGFKWHPATEEAYHYLSIKSTPSMRADTRTQRREFWNSLPLKINKILHPEKFPEEIKETVSHNKKHEEL